ncbi:MAG: transglutaminase family protein [Thiovulaceae bacterium]|nr:transglutaminase family protein [Sulfurimonadaceae bacterium]
MQEYLFNSDLINFDHPSIQPLAQELSKDLTNDLQIARNCFNYVRDEINHSGDHKDAVTTCIASDVLLHQTGWCYAKSHLLAALLRANKIPTGFCYQRLSISGSGAPYSLHGLNAIYLKEFGWYRADARGNKEGVNAQFDPPQEQLAFAINDPEQEYDFPEIYAEPLGIVRQALFEHKSYDAIVDNLPDLIISKG